MTVNANRNTGRGVGLLPGTGRLVVVWPVTLVGVVPAAHVLAEVFGRTGGYYAAAVLMAAALVAGATRVTGAATAPHPVRSTDGMASSTPDGPDGMDRPGEGSGLVGAGGTW